MVRKERNQEDTNDIIIIHENINLEKLTQVINCSNLPSNDKTDVKLLNDYYKSCIKSIKKNGYHIVEYKQTHTKDRYYSRLSLQSIQKTIRKYITDDRYKYLDISNCAPTILNQKIN